MNGMSEDLSSMGSSAKQPEGHNIHYNKDAMPGSELWTDGLICAFEFVPGRRKSVRPKPYSRILSMSHVDIEEAKTHMPTLGGAEPPQRRNMKISTDPESLLENSAHGNRALDGNADRTNLQSDCFHFMERFEGTHWIPIGWARISDLVRTVQIDAGWSTQQIVLTGDEDDLTVADLAAPYWECQVGPTWWCHVAAGHPFVDAWLNSAQWLHPAISIALRDESRLLSDRMKHLFYEGNKLARQGAEVTFLQSRIIPGAYCERSKMIGQAC